MTNMKKLWLCAGVLFSAAGLAGCSANGGMVAEAEEGADDLRQELLLGGQWEQEGRSPRHTAHNPSEITLTAATVPGLHMAWSRPAVQPSNPAVWNRQLFVNSNDWNVNGVLTSLDLIDGTVLWETEGTLTAPRISDSIAVAYGRVLAFNEFPLVAASTKTGAEVWTGPRFRGEESGSSGVVLAGTFAYINADTSVEAEQPLGAFWKVTDSGTIEWRVDYDGQFGGNNLPAVANDKVFLTGGNRSVGRVLAFSTVDGHEVWRSADSPGDSYSSLAVYRNLVYSVSSATAGSPRAAASRAWLTAVRADTGALTYSIPVKGTYLSGSSSHRRLTVADDRVLVATDDPTDGIIVSAFDRRSGAALFDVKIGHGYLSASDITSAADVAYFGTSAGHLYAVNVGNGALLADVDVGAHVYSEPVVSDGHVYVSTENTLYALSL